MDLNMELFYKIAYSERKPVSAIIELLTQCNLRCKHCYIPAHTNAGIKSEKVKELLYELHDMGTLNISFTGGEIFLHCILRASTATVAFFNGRIAEQNGRM